MKKKINIFGKEFGVFALVAVSMIAIVSAALVPYLSNQVDANVSVESPIEMFLSDNNEDWAHSITLDNMYGGQKADFNSRIENKLNEPINAAFNVVISNAGTAATCADFDQFMVDGTWGPSVLDSTCFENGDGTIYIPGTVSLTASETKENNVGFEFALNVKPDTYTFSTQIMYTTPSPSIA